MLVSSVSDAASQRINRASKSLTNRINSFGSPKPVAPGPAPRPATMLTSKPTLAPSTKPASMAVDNSSAMPAARPATMPLRNGTNGVQQNRLLGGKRNTQKRRKHTRRGGMCGTCGTGGARKGKSMRMRRHTKKHKKSKRSKSRSHRK